MMNAQERMAFEQAMDQLFDCCVEALTAVARKWLEQHLEEWSDGLDGGTKTIVLKQLLDQSVDLIAEHAEAVITSGLLEERLSAHGGLLIKCWEANGGDGGEDMRGSIWEAIESVGGVYTGPIPGEEKWKNDETVCLGME